MDEQKLTGKETFSRRLAALSCLFFAVPQQVGKQQAHAGWENIS
jgi:hypothetical protein